MNPLQLRETTIDPDTRRLVQLTIDAGDDTTALMDMLLAKKRAGDRKVWLEKNGNLADIASPNKAARGGITECEMGAVRAGQ